MQDVVQKFRTGFFDVVRTAEHAEPLKQAALASRLGAWTRVLTKVSVEVCNRMGWKASARSHKLDLLPIRNSEYLGMDIIAFPDGQTRWRFPIAVIELENVQAKDRIAYSLWKVLSVRTELRAVYCYSRRGDLAPALVKHLQTEVITAMGLAGRAKLEGRTLLVIGSRNETETFPYGFFNWWELDYNTGRFERT